MRKLYLVLHSCPNDRIVKSTSVQAHLEQSVLNDRSFLLPPVMLTRFLKIANPITKVVIRKSFSFFSFLMCCFVSFLHLTLVTSFVVSMVVRKLYMISYLPSESCEILYVGYFHLESSFPCELYAELLCFPLYFSHEVCS